MGASAAAVSALQGRRRISCLTAYDATMASLVDRAGIDVILVGDSAGMVVMGQDDNLTLSIEMLLTNSKSFTDTVWQRGNYP